MKTYLLRYRNAMMVMAFVSMGFGVKFSIRYHEPWYMWPVWMLIGSLCGLALSLPLTGADYLVRNIVRRFRPGRADRGGGRFEIS